jgi:hypothetical protein
MDPIRIWNKLLVYWIFDNTIVIINIISRNMNRTMLETKHIWKTFFGDSCIPKIIDYRLSERKWEEYKTKKTIAEFFQLHNKKVNFSDD